jgi:predicted unusual protein kinase regulating ubiquinone biosynthesis (AarF/ABC1/UbiB family)
MSCYLECIVILYGTPLSSQKKASALQRDGGAAGAEHAAIARDMKDKFIALGPTYIKLGQLLSARPDLVRAEYATAFRGLQDRVPAFSSALAVATVEKELGMRLGDAFSSFNSTPIAAASIGQVHLATLQGSSDMVAVKVQRPGLRGLFDMDLGALRLLTRVLAQAFPLVDGVAFDWKGLFEEYTAVMYQELDYRREGLMGIRFRNNFADLPWVAIPKVPYCAVLCFCAVLCCVVVCWLCCVVL